jgi:hypothetical protein
MVVLKRQIENFPTRGPQRKGIKNLFHHGYKKKMNLPLKWRIKLIFLNTEGNLQLSIIPNITDLDQSRSKKDLKSKMSSTDNKAVSLRSRNDWHIRYVADLLKVWDYCDPDGNIVLEEVANDSDDSDVPDTLRQREASKIYERKLRGIEKVSERI